MAITVPPAVSARTREFIAEVVIPVEEQTAGPSEVHRRARQS
jgi:hypothetical protein